MCQYSSDDGFANDWHLVHLGSRAVGGAGLVMTEATAVTPKGASARRISASGTTTTSRRSRASCASSTAQGASPASSSRTPAARPARARPWEGGRASAPPRAAGPTWSRPSAMPFADGYPDAAGARRATGSARVVEAFADGARRARWTRGSTSSRSTRRTATCCTSSCRRSVNTRDRRVRRLVREPDPAACSRSCDAVRGVWPERLPLFVRISATDWVEGGWDIEQSIELARRLRRTRRGPDRLLVGRQRGAGDDPGGARATRCRSPSASAARPASRPARSG